MKRSPLHRWHEKAGATLAENQGWLVPLRYSNAGTEAAAVSASLGICDLTYREATLSPNARFLIAGPNTGGLLSKVTSLNPELAKAYGLVAHVRALVERNPLGYLIMVPRDYAEFVWEALLHAGEEFHIAPFGLEAHGRLEA